LCRYHIEHYVEVSGQKYPVVVIKHGATGNVLYNQASGAAKFAVAPADGAAAGSAPAVAESQKSA
jgi:hypothetical protein